MAIDRATQAMLMVMALGAALVAVPWLKRSSKNPLPDAFYPGSVGFEQLQITAQQIDDACIQGDLAAFQLHVTQRRAQDLARRAELAGCSFDAAALGQLVRSGGLAQHLSADFLQGQTFGDRSLVVLSDNSGQLAADNGVQMIAFTWHFGRFLLDDILPAQNLAPSDLSSIAAWLGRYLHLPPTR